MNYYVVSPNAWNDGNFMDYLNYMKCRHVVFMGWNKNNKFGRIFANMQIGDRVIVARGANWQKNLSLSELLIHGQKKIWKADMALRNIVNFGLSLNWRKTSFLLRPTAHAERVAIHERYINYTLIMRRMQK